MNKIKFISNYSQAISLALSPRYRKNLIFLLVSTVILGSMVTGFAQENQDFFGLPDYRNRISVNSQMTSNPAGNNTIIFNGSVNKPDDENVPNNGAIFLVKSAFGLPVNLGEKVDFKFGETITADHEIFSDLPAIDLGQEPKIAEEEKHKVVWVEATQTLFTADPGFVHVTWKDVNGNDVGPIRYLVGQTPASLPMALFHTHGPGTDFIDDAEDTTDDFIPEPTTEAPLVDAKNNPNIRWHWNTAIPQYDPGSKPVGNEQQGEFLTIVTDSGPNRNLYAQGRTGLILLEYRDENDQFKAMEIVEVRRNTQDIEISQVDVGQRLAPNVIVSQPGDPKISRGHDEHGQDERFVYRYENSNSPDNGALFAVHKTENARDIEIYWTRIGAEGVIWPYELHRYTADWPPEERRQLNVRGGSEENRGWTVRFPENLTATLMPYQEPVGHAELVTVDNRFITSNEGLALLRYDFDSPAGSDTVAFEVVESKFRENLEIGLPSETLIGAEIVDEYHTKGDVPISQAPGWIYVAPHADPLLRENRYAAEVYQNTGQIFAVNEGMLEVWWMNLSHGVQWPSSVKRYNCVWPPETEKIIIARQNGTGVIDSAAYPQWQLYVQNDASLPGFNPNDEHASVESFQSGQAIFARRDDLYLENDRDSSKPYAMMQYRASEDENASWGFRIWNVIAEEAPYTFSDWQFDLPADHDPATDPYETVAGAKFLQPLPLDYRTENQGISGPFWTDRKLDEWAMAAGDNGPTDTSTIIMRFYYSYQPSFYFPDETHNPGDLLPWLDRKSEAKGTPIDVSYTIRWPEKPNLKIAETSMKGGNNIPVVDGQCSAEIIYQQGLQTGQGIHAHIIDPIQERFGTVILEQLPPEIQTDTRAIDTPDGLEVRTVFRDLPPHLMPRIFYDEEEGLLSIKGLYVSPERGADYVLPNIVTDSDLRELESLKDMINDPEEKTIFGSAISELHEIAKNPLFLPTSGGTVDHRLAITAGLAESEGWMTLALQNAEACDELPVDVTPIYVGEIDDDKPRLFAGEISVVKPECPFDETLTLRYKVDFAGQPGNFELQWVSTPSGDGEDPLPPGGEDQSSWNQQGWRLYPHGNSVDGRGVLEVIVEGANPFTLKDNWFTCRYRYVADEDRPWKNEWSEWADPQLAEGWIKRVVGEINPFTQRATGGGIEGAEDRFDKFAERDVNTIVSMIAQAGERWDGDVPLNCQDLDEFGLIETYETVLRRGIKLSIDGVNGHDDPDLNNALLLVASRIADLYTLQGNEAFADAADPTIAFGTDDGQYGSEATSIHAFMNQTASLLEEELVLLRGRPGKKSDPKLDFDLQKSPVYNRLVWNFTGDPTGGEVAYALNYNIVDQDGTVSGVINEEDAKTLFPQGHGDAWGHYLAAIKAYYSLLSHPNYTWLPRTEHVLVGGQPLAVDFLDERKFARIAAAKARTGTEIVNLTYREQYIEDPEGQWQGYEDSDPQRAWGISAWASRVGTGNYIDWVVANAILPDVDDNPEHSGIRKIDRSTIPELREIVQAFSDVQSQIDNADSGLNPLGLAKDVVPFDISPVEITNGKTHFEQIYERAIHAVNNAIAVFDYANNSTQNLRRQSDTLDRFQDTVDDREADLNNRLIEIFGTPYPDDIGTRGAYEVGYNGPDWKNHDYVDSELLGSLVDPKIQSITRTFAEPHVTDDGGLEWNAGQPSTFYLSDLGSPKPDNWTSERETIGQAQLAKRDLILAIARFGNGLKEYDRLIDQIEQTADSFEEQNGISATQIDILEKNLDEVQNLNSKIKKSRKRQLWWKRGGKAAIIEANAVKEWFPRASGMSPDFTAPQRAAIMLRAALLNEVAMWRADENALTELDHQNAKENNGAQAVIDLRIKSNEQVTVSQKEELKQLIRKEASLRDEIYVLQEMMHQVAGHYNAVVARGARLLEDQLRFKHQTADKVQQFRYKDMAFRIFRNDALEKYRSQFDLAAMYVYLAAKAYAFETNLLNTDKRSGQQFLNNIVRARTIGIVQNGLPLTGTNTLTDALAQMNSNWGNLKTQLGFNNDQSIKRAFKLRQELFRIAKGDKGKTQWQEVLQRHRVDDVRNITEISRLAILPGSTPEPGIVIPFGTHVQPGMNFFINDEDGVRKSIGEDNTFPSSYFAIKIRGAGVWFTGYNGLDLLNTPSAYLLPIGNDVLRVPGSIDELRQWSILDQVIPTPFAIGTEILDASWSPMSDHFSSVFKIRRFPEIPAGHDFGNDDSGNNVKINNTLLVGRSVWNTRWLLVIPGRNLLGSDPEHGLDLFIHGRDGMGGVSDIRLFFDSYGYGGI